MRRCSIGELVGFAEADQGFNADLRLNQAEVYEDGSFALVATVEEYMLNPYGIIHGGALFTLCDNAAGTFMSVQGRYSVTMSSELSFYLPCRLGDELRARPSARKLGKTVSIVQVEVLNQRDERVADGLFHMYRANYRE